ncbi:MAG TPA: DUF502 domain-containing protein [Gemmatimonadales bacterium]
MSPPRGITRRIVGWFARGLLITAPVALTLWIAWAVIRWVDRLLGLDFPGAGLVVTLTAITLIGALASTFLARSIVVWIEDLMESVPFIRLLYTSTKDLLGAFVGEKRRFTKAVRVALSEDGGVSVLGFVTAESLADLGVADQVGVYLPQSYNFAGQLIVVPARRVTPVGADSAEVMAFIVSGGVSKAGRPSTDH